MSKKLQLRGGTTTEHASFTGAVREVTVDTDKDTLVIHDGSTAGGFPLPRTDAEIRTAVEAATDSNVFTDADHTKLNAIEASADVTDTANVVAALTAGSNITIAANGTIAGAAQYTHPTHAGDDASVDTGALSGATVISDLDFNITTDTLGHVTDANATVATRNLTLANLGYTGATNANYIDNNTQITNGSGFTTYTSNQPTNTNNNVTFETGTFNGSLYVNQNDSQSNIYMQDTDEGVRQIHCNSHRVGFLNTSGGWGSYCNDNGSWVSTSTITATAFHGDGSNLTGVGGQTLSQSGNFSNGATSVWFYLDPQYKYHTLFTYGPDVNAGNWTGPSMRLGTTTTSNSSTTYAGKLASDMAKMYQNSSIRMGAGYASDYIGMFEFINAGVSSAKTMMAGSDLSNSPGAGADLQNFFYVANTAQANHYVKMAFDVYSSGWTFKGQGNWEVWGYN
jgi:hypothetical protein